MSFINDALKKAQQSRDSRYSGYEHLISGPAPDSAKRYSGFRRKFKWASIYLVTIGMVGVGIFAFFQSRPDLFGLAKTTGKPLNAGVQAQKAQEAAPAETTVQVPVELDLKALYKEALDSQVSGNMQKAQELYRKILSVNPEHVDALNNLGVILMARPDKAEAISIFNKIITLQSGFADAYYNLACIYAQMKDVPKGIEYLGKAVERNGDLRRWAKQDRDLENLRGFAGFNKIMQKKDG